MENESNPILLFDGVCNLCNSIVQFIIRRDPSHKFKFASMQSSAGQAILNSFHIPGFNNDTFVLVCGDKYYTRSTAALTVLKILGGGWKIFYAFILVPSFIRDAVYQFVARIRYRVFGKRTNCMIPSDDSRSRFLE